jgi:2-haloacid dehalogenase
MRDRFDSFVEGHAPRSRPRSPATSSNPGETVVLTAVVFDLGGVLIDWNPRYLYRKLFPGDEAAMEAFLAEVTTAEWNVQQDAGRPWDEAIEVLAVQHPEQRDLIAAFRLRWEEMLGGPIEQTVEILAELRRAGVRLIALTNWSADTFAIAQPRFTFLEWFEGIVVSGEVGVAKPDERIFRHLIERHGLEPRSTLFVDDSEANVRAAAALGFHTIRYENSERLRADLVDLGLLPTN